MGLVKEETPPGVFGRGLRLGKLGLSLTGSYLGYQAQNLFLGEDQREARQRTFHRRTSQQVRAELGSLKGAAMKLGQLLSQQTTMLSPEAIEELAHLQMSAPGMHPTLARAQFKASTGRAPEDVFAEFDPEPFAAASLGQVHRAVTRAGEKVAVKIQYPAIRTAIENDFKLLRSATLPARVSGHMPAAVLDEVQRGFLEETDYLQEARNIRFFSKGLRGFGYLTVPSVYPELTTNRVLTMSFVEGASVGEFLKTKPPAAVRDLIGERLVELYYFQLHRLRALHADHHPGNYLFLADGRIGLVDYGCVKHVHFDVGDLIRSCVVRSWRKGDREARRILGYIFGAGVPYERARRMLPALETVAAILFPRGTEGALVDFRKPELLGALGGALKKAVRDKVTNAEFAFLSRAEIGLYSLLHQLGARVDVASVWRRVDV